MSKYLGRIEHSQVGDHVVELHRTALQDNLHRMFAFDVRFNDATVLGGRMAKTAADYAYQAVITTVKLI